MSPFKRYLLKAFYICGSVFGFPVFADPPIAVDASIVSVMNKSGMVGTGVFVAPQVVVTALHNIDDFYKPVKDNIFLIHSETGVQISVSSVRSVDFRNDIILLNVENFRSHSYYDLNLLPSSEYSEAKSSYVLGMLNGQLVRLNGLKPLAYSQEDPLLRRITYMSSKEIEGLSGSPIFAEDGKLLGIVNGYERGVNLVFTQIQAVRRILNRHDSAYYDNVNKLIQASVDFSDKAVQFRFGWHELNRMSLYKPNMSEQEKQKIRNSQIGVAVHWFRQSANQGYPPAMLELANIHALGQGVFEVDMQKSQNFVEQAANADFAPAQHRRGIFLIHIKDRLNEGVHWLKLAAQQGYFGNISALTLLSTEGIPFTVIIKALNDLSTAGHPQAKAILAHYLFEGEVVAQDIERAKRLLGQAVSAEYAPAIQHLFLLHQEEKYGYPKDSAEAVELLGKMKQLEYFGGNNRPPTIGDGVKQVSKGVLEACRGFIARSLSNRLR